MNKIFYLSISAVIFFNFTSFPLTLQAQEEEEKKAPVPSPPFFIIPETGRWEVTIKEPEPQNENSSPEKKSDSKKSDAYDEEPQETVYTPRKLKKVIVTQTGPIRHFINIWDDNGKTEDWELKEYRMNENPYTKKLGIYCPSASVGDTEHHQDITAIGFKWLSEKNFVKVVKYEKVKCFLFEKGYNQEEPAQPAESHPEASSDDLYKNVPTANPKGTLVWISVKTGRPVARKESNTLYTFKFKAPPKKRLKLPSAYAKLYKRVMELSQVRRVPVR